MSCDSKSRRPIMNAEWWWLLVQLLWLAQGQEVVQTAYGKLRGQLVASGRDTPVVHFYSVPYAKPPTGDLRFRPPQPPEPWSGVLDATVMSPGCPQQPDEENKPFALREDCLYLNIYVPQPCQLDSSTCSARSGLLPVMVYFHGGAFVGGTGATRTGHALAGKDVIVVCPNYRLGPLGFLSTQDSSAPGNYGMLDQVMALTWVKDNIAAFGGHSGKVTVAGESAGAKSVSLHLLSPKSAGLFRSAILMSGASLSERAVSLPQDHPSPLEQAKELGRGVGCYHDDTTALVACLRQKPAMSLIHASVNVGTGRSRWLPTVDGDFLPDSPRRLVAQGRLARLPVLGGCTSNEMSIFPQITSVPGHERGITLDTFKHLVRVFVDQRFGQNQDKIAEAIVKTYTGHMNTADPAAVRHAYIQLWSDHDYCLPSYYMSLASARVNCGQPVYAFLFDHRSVHSHSPAWTGVSHASDLLYVFGYPLMPPNQNHVTAFNQQWSQEDREVSDLVMTLHANFVKFSDPTPTPVQGVTWTEYSESSQAYLHIGSKSSGMAVNFHQEQFKLWYSTVPSLAGSDARDPLETSLTSLPSDQCHGHPDNQKVPTTPTVQILGS